MKKAPHDSVALEGTDRPLPPGARAVGPAPPGQILQVTVVLYSATPSAADRAAMRAFGRRHHLKLIRSNLSGRTLVVSGTSENFCTAFGVVRTKYTSPLGTFYGHSGPVHLPRALAHIVDGVIGLNEFPVRRVSAGTARVRKVTARSGRKKSFHPFQMANIYRFPESVNGRGQTVALIELSGGFKQRDMAKYFKKLGLRVPKIVAVSVDGTPNKPGPRTKMEDLETQGDIETLGSVAPGARIVVYQAPMTERGLYDAVVKAIHDKKYAPSIISISFGEVEMYWPPRTLRLLNDALHDAAMLGITVCCAAGDSGSSGGVPGGKPHVFFPASSPMVLACGGTALKTRGDTIVEERVWRDGRHATTGGGVSRIFARPLWQSMAKVPRSPNKALRHGRGLPDVAANAAAYLLVADGKSIVIGGTSAVAPLWAGLIARLNQKRGRPLGFLNPILYGMYEQLRSICALREITKGSNGAYRARRGWDPCTGLGSPDGARLLEHLVPS